MTGAGTTTPPRPPARAVLVAACLLLFLTSCVVLFGHRAEAPANGLTLAQLEAALPDADGWATRPVDGAAYREREIHLDGDRLVELARLSSRDDRIELHVYALGRPDTAQSREWRARLDRMVSALDATHPAIGPWAYEDETGDHRFEWAALLVGVALALGGGAVLIRHRLGASG